MTVKIKTNARKVAAQMDKAALAFDDSVRFILNSMAIAAADYQRKRIRDGRFTLRNKYTENSIFPKEKTQGFGAVRFGGHSTGLGLIPPSQKNWRTMYSEAGTIQPYMKEQEFGYNRNNPKPPTRAARVGKNIKKKISKSGKLKTLRAMKALKTSMFSKQPTRRAKVTAMIETAKRNRIKGGKNSGVFWIGRNQILPPGFWRAKKIGRKGERGTLELIRLWQPGTHRRKGKKWFTTGKQTFSEAAAQNRYNMGVDSMLRFLEKV